MQDTEKTISVLWQDYLFLTTEMGRFLEKQDIDLFLELISQRERLQSMIENKQKQMGMNSPPKEEILTEINKANQVVMDKLRYLMNMEDKQHNLSHAYDVYNSNLGIRADWKS